MGKYIGIHSIYSLHENNMGTIILQYFYYKRKRKLRQIAILTIRSSSCKMYFVVDGTWRSLVARFLGVEEVASSNLAVPTNAKRFPLGSLFFVYILLIIWYTICKYVLFSTISRTYISIIKE